MFTLSERPTFTHDVEVRVPIDGGVATQTLKATFRVMPTDEFQAYDLSDGGRSAEFLREVIVELDGIEDGEKNKLPYSDQVRDQVLNLSYARAALARTYFAAVGGATLGN